MPLRSSTRGREPGSLAGAWPAFATTGTVVIGGEIGVDSKVALAKLKELGEYVKSPSSTIAPPVARKLCAALEADGAAKPAEAPAAKAPAARPSTGSR